MKTEIIIAARGELPENLKRTIEGVIDAAPVCIVYDGNEPPRAGEKPKRIAATDRIRVLTPWNAPRGCGQARHYGIMTSKADAVILIDGHMQFPDGFADKITEHLRRFPKHVTCCSTQSLSRKWEPLSGEVYHGAYMALKTTEPQVDIIGPAVEYFALSAKWRKDPPPKNRIIPAPMGACYGMRRDWYLAMGAPFSILEAWGGEEELLAICAALCGGGIFLMPLTCGHMHAAPHQGRQIHPAGRWANRLAIVRAIPEKDASNNLEEHMIRTGVAWGVIEGLIDQQRQPKIETLRAHLAAQKHTWADTLKRWGVTGKISAHPPARQSPFVSSAEIIAPPQIRAPEETTAIPPAPANDTPQIFTQKMMQCDRCAAYNSFRKIGTRRAGNIIVHYSRCVHCGHKAQIRQYL